MGIFAHLDSVVNTKRGILTKIYRRGPVKGGHTFFFGLFFFGLGIYIAVPAGSLGMIACYVPI